MIRRAALIPAIILTFISFALGQNLDTAQIDGLVSQFSQKGYFSGVVLVAKDGKVIYEKAFGPADAEFDIPNTPATRIGFASITKPMTSIILARLVESGKIKLSDTVAKFLPDFPNGAKITVSMLANHRAGIPHRVMPSEQESVAHSSADMVRWIAKAKLDFEPGSKRSYSSAGYTLLARLLEIASGKTYSEMLEEYVFRPAGMKDSFEYDGSAIIKLRSREYLLRPVGLINAPFKDYSFLVGAGSVYGTADDLYRFSGAVLEGKYGEAVTKELAPEGKFEASGRTNGHRAYVDFSDRGKNGYVVLSNLSSGAFDIIAGGLRDYLGGKDISGIRFAFPELENKTKRDLTEYVGIYKRDDGGAFNIVAKDGALFSADLGIYPTKKKDCFFDFSFFGDVCFGRDASGKVNTIVWKGGNFELRGKK